MIATTFDCLIIACLANSKDVGRYGMLLDYAEEHSAQFLFKMHEEPYGYDAVRFPTVLYRSSCPCEVTWREGSEHAKRLRYTMNPHTREVITIEGRPIDSQPPIVERISLGDFEESLWRSGERLLPTENRQ